MRKHLQTFVTSFALLPLLSLWASCPAQSGSRVGLNAPAAAQELAPLSPQEAQSFITVGGSAVIRVQPTHARVILGITMEAKGASECKNQIDTKIARLREAWIAAGVDRESIVEDFVSVIPRYDFEIKKVEGQTIAAETKIGYSMQTNVHLALAADDAILEKALDVAFANEVTDIIGFDFWSDELDEKKKEVRKLAIESAKEKSVAMLDAVFDKRPQVINIQEKTKVHFPSSMYRSFENTSASQYLSSYNNRKNIPRILLSRPKNIFYHGHVSNADIIPKGLQMRSEISVESHVEIYYESPAAAEFNSNKVKP